MRLPTKSIRLLPLMDNSVFEVRQRRLELAARFVEYAWMCDNNRPIKLALLDSKLLFESGAYRHGWFGAFATRVAALGVDPTSRRGLAAAVQTGIVALMNTE